MVKLNRSLLIITVLVLTIMSCSENSVSTVEPHEEHTILKVANQVTDNRYISSVHLVGYKFDNIHIPSGKSQTFILDKGMRGGHDNINVIVNYRTSRTPTNNQRTSVNFKNGEITTIALKGCISYEGCSGYSLK